MKVREVAQVIEEFAPLSLQESYDNCGLNVGSPDDEVHGVLLCVDVTEEVVDEAQRLGANLIVSHHPLLFHPLRQVVDSNAAERIVRRCLIDGISLYAAHTNLDAAPQGMSYRLGRLLGLENMAVLEAHPQVEGAGFGVVGTLAEEWVMEKYLREVKRLLGCGAVRYSALCCERVRRVALCTGAGASLIEQAVCAGAQLYVAADFKYNDFYTPDRRIVVADVGHFESEYCAIELLSDVITKKIATFAVHKSVHSVNPVYYLV